MRHTREREHLGNIGDPKGHDRGPRLRRTSTGILQYHLVDGVSLDHRERRRRLNLFGREQRDPVIAADQSQQRPERGRLRVDRRSEGPNGRRITAGPLVALGETLLDARKRPPDHRVERMRILRISLVTVRHGSPPLLGLTAAGRGHPQGGCAGVRIAYISLTDAKKGVLRSSVFGELLSCIA